MAIFPTSTHKRRWCISILTVVVIAIIIAIVVPLAVIIPKRGKHGEKSTILLPLYIYPELNTTWSQLYEAVEARPQLKFIVIVNPSSGPGSARYPNDDYTTSVRKLNTYANIQTVGYVRTGYGSRNISDVVAEVSTYAGWASNSSALAMHGIFFDETPHQYSADAVEFMRTANLAAKNARGLQGDKTIIHNPGTIPDIRYNDTNTDITVVFEDSYPAYATALNRLTALSGHRSRYSYMINSVPSTINLQKFVDDISKRAKFLFITDLTKDFYESFGTAWETFTNVVPT